MQSKIDLATDEEFILAYKNNIDYTNMAKALGYAQNINNNVRLKIKERLKKLKLPLYEGKKDVSTLTKGELFNNRKNYQSARSAIVKNAQNVYAKSQKPKKCAICGYNKHYEIAHIKAVANFSDDTLISVINDKNNLIALCPNHHWEYDNNLLNFAGQSSGSLASS